MAPFTIDQEIFAELYFCVLIFSAFNFHHLASIYIVEEFFACLIIFDTHASDRRKLNDGEFFAIYGMYMV